MRSCDHCGAGFEPDRRTARFCSRACRLRAFRRRRAGLPESAYPELAYRGPVPLEQLTRRELASAIASARPVCL